MDNFYIVTNESKDANLEATKRIQNYLMKRGKVCHIGAEAKRSQNDFCSTRPEDLPKDVECVIVLGGDGTLLRAARNLVDLNVPLIGINLGTLGYLTEGDQAGIPDLLQKLIADEYVIEPRMMIAGRILAPDGSVMAEDVALNDLTVNRSHLLRIFRFKVYVNGEFLYLYTADGIIVSTPTGSTAYNLSCGGPIVEPTARLFLVTPIAPHSLNNRSLILSCRDKIEIEILGSEKDLDSEVKYVAYFDGESEIVLEPGCRIELQQAEQVTKILKLRTQSFLETLRIKMS